MSKDALHFDTYVVAPIKQEDAWPLCDFIVANSERLKDFFPLTLKENLNPTLSKLFVAKKVREFEAKEEFLFTVKENTHRTIMALVYVKELQKVKGQGELAYCIGYQYAGQGLMSKIIGKIVSWSFDCAKLDTLQIIVHETNVASIRVAEKNNFAWQKTLSKAYDRPGVGFVDMELYERYNK